MEIGSMDSMFSMVGMQNANGLSTKANASEMSDKFMDSLDSGGDDSSSESGMSVDDSSESTESSQVYDVLDTNEDGFVSQEEYDADQSSLMSALKQQLSGLGGIQQGKDSEGFNQLMDMLGTPSDAKEQGVNAYEQMQNGMAGGPNGGGQSYSAGLDIRA